MQVVLSRFMFIMAGGLSDAELCGCGRIDG